LPDPLAASHEAIILDACCVITLSCTGRIAEILSSLPKPVMVADYVYENEVLRFDLQDLVDEALLTVVSADTEAEQNLLVNFAVDLDDGEAVTGAIGVLRTWAIATDDRKALALFGRVAPLIELISTLDMVKHWAAQTARSEDEIKEALENLHVGAPYEPKSSHPLYTWWRRYVAM
jgi:hypothetical protein